MKPLLLTAALLTCTALLPPTATAEAASATEGASVNMVDIAVSPAGFTAPDRLTAGVVTFRVSSTDPDGAWLGLVRPRPGVTLEQYLGDLERAMGADPVGGGQAVARDVEMLGGVAVAHVPASATLPVAPGSYYLVDFRDVGKPDLASRVRPVRVAPGRASTDVRAESTVVALDGRYLTPGVLRGPVRFVNLSPQANEAMLMPVRPGATLTDLDAFFAHRAPAPFTGGPTGVVPLSQGRSAVLAHGLPAGRYALVTWVTDVRTGKMFAAGGMRALVTVED
ncbi:hypothetical protein ABZ816_13635 [Actinosynnema sp. NPDC047251]|nr:hypothetical protein [Saccharothrix espanaensis]